MPVKHRALSKGNKASITDPDDAESILIVDDEPMVLRLCSSILKREGYEVLSTNPGKEALRICWESGRKLDSLLCDVIMPKIRGPELAGLVSEMRPEIRVLFMSGFDGGGIPEYDSLSRRSQLIPKPFRPGDLVHAVRAALEKPMGL